MTDRIVKIGVTYDMIEAWERWSAHITVPGDVADEDIEEWIMENSSEIELFDLKDNGSYGTEIADLEILDLPEREN